MTAVKKVDERVEKQKQHARAEADNAKQRMDISSGRSGSVFPPKTIKSANRTTTELKFEASAKTTLANTTKKKSPQDLGTDFKVGHIIASMHGLALFFLDKASAAKKTLFFLAFHIALYSQNAFDKVAADIERVAAQKRVREDEQARQDLLEAES